MMTLIDQVRDVFQQAIAISYPELSNPERYVIVTHGTKKEFGDYQCNSAMSLAKPLKKSPREIALTLLLSLDDLDHPFSNHDVAGPGFINVTIKDDLLESISSDLCNDPSDFCSGLIGHQRIVIDYSSPNVAKEMHVGHLRSSIIGDCLARVFRFLKCDVMALNHIGDWGTAFGMLIAHLEDQAPGVIHGEAAASGSELVAWYQAAKQRFDADATFKQRAQQAVVALQQGEQSKRQAWQHICALSAESYQVIYDLLDVHLTVRGESFYQPMLQSIVDELNDQQLLTKHDGADCVFLTDFHNREGNPLPLIVRKTDGGFNYATTDLAALRHRLADERADRILYVVDAGQSTHFAMVFETARLAGWWQPKQTDVRHVPFGLVLGSDGKKFRTRSGKTEKLIDLLQHAIEQARVIVRERHPDWSEPMIQETGQQLGIGAVKYADLSVNRTSDYQFDYEKMLRFDGNTAAFVTYAHARMCSILTKLAVADQPKQTFNLTITHPTERALSLHLARFSECMQQITKEYCPHKLTDYLFKLAELCNAFHRDCHVIGHEHQQRRVQWCQACRMILAQGLTLLGIAAPRQM